MKLPFLAAILSFTATLAGAEPVKVASPFTVAETIDRLETTVTGAGATVFARINHAGGAESVGESLYPMELLIFGNPKLGTAALQADPQAGMLLPLRVLAYQDTDGQVWLSYEQPVEMFEGFDVPADAMVVQKMTGALANLTAKALEN